MNYYQKSKKEVLKLVDGSEKGLSDAYAELRIKEYGLNEIKETKKISPLTIFLRQFKSFIVGILLVAILLSVIIGEFIDAGVIAIIVIINSIFGFIQEYRAEKSIEALKKLASPKAKVIRNNKEKEIEAKYIVPGDIVILQEGDKVSADARLIMVSSLETQESSLTGESTPISKNISTISKKVTIADQKNMVFSGTIITRGNAKAIVVKTAMETEIGKIASLIQETEEEPTPLQIKLKSMGKKISIATIFICLIVFLTGVFKGIGMSEMFITAISLAVAAIPEGLPAIVTISLALGVKRMVKKNVLMRTLPTIETLGTTTVICSDKTGTLTRNEMTVRKVYVDNKNIDVSGEGYVNSGKFSDKTKNLPLLLEIGSLCNNSIIQKNNAIGDPTEAALIISAEKLHLKKRLLDAIKPRINEIPFESERKLMSTLHKTKNGTVLYTKGAPDIILKKCSKIIINDKIQKLTEKEKQKILDKNNELASNALRVLGFAFKKTKKMEEENLIFVGLQAMKDPPRNSVREDIKKCKQAGIKVVMITGDHQLTAEAIAKEIGIEGESITGEDIGKDLENKVENIAIYARVNPSHKMQIIKALKKKGHIVAMTGDGVNDAPALKNADIGIAMGIKGTEVAKEASDMILTDDHFSSIVKAVREGRGIYINIKKFVNYLLSSNFGEILVIFIASIIGWPLPLIAIQILWINLITDGLPALALGVDPIGKGIMNLKPRNSKEHIITKNMSATIILTGILIAIATLIIFHKYLPDIEKARTMAFTSLVVFELVRVYIVRAQYKIKLFSNKFLILAVTASLLLQLIVIYTPLSILFKTTYLSIIEWMYIIMASIAILIIGTIAIPIIKILTKQED